MVADAARVNVSFNTYVTRDWVWVLEFVIVQWKRL